MRCRGEQRCLYLLRLHTIKASQKRTNIFLCFSRPCVSQNAKPCINFSNGQTDKVKYDLKTLKKKKRTNQHNAHFFLSATKGSTGAPKVSPCFWISALIHYAGMNSDVHGAPEYIMEEIGSPDEYQAYLPHQIWPPSALSCAWLPRCAAQARPKDIQDG